MAASRIRCISIDIDGTLFQEGAFDCSGLTQDNVEEIKKFYGAGGRIILATGRDYPNTEDVCKELYRRGVPMDAIPYMVCLNGAMIVDNRDHRTIIYRRNFDGELCSAIVKFLQKRRLNFFLLGCDNRLHFPSNPAAKIIFWFLNRRGKFLYQPAILYRNTKFGDIQRIMIIKLSPGVKDLKRRITDLFGDRVYCSSGPRHFLEIVDKEVNKFLALKRISAMMDIPIEEFAAIGNEENDIMSLQNVGYGAGVDLEKKRGNFHWDEEKIGGHYTNEKGTAVAKAIRDMRSRGYF